MKNTVSWIAFSCGWQKINSKGFKQCGNLLDHVSRKGYVRWGELQDLLMQGFKFGHHWPRLILLLLCYTQCWLHPNANCPHEIGSPPVATQTTSFLCYIYWEVEEHIFKKYQVSISFYLFDLNYITWLFLNIAGKSTLAWFKQGWSRVRDCGLLITS